MKQILFALAFVIAPQSDSRRRWVGKWLAGLLQQPFDGQLCLIGKLVAVAPDEFDAVILCGVVRGGERDAQIVVSFAHQVGDGGGGQYAGGGDLGALGAESADERGFEHGAATACVASN